MLPTHFTEKNTKKGKGRNKGKKVNAIRYCNMMMRHKHFVVCIFDHKHYGKDNIIERAKINNSALRFSKVMSKILELRAVITYLLSKALIQLILLYGA